MNRGGQVMSEIVASCRSHDFTDVIFVNEVRGIPNGMIISHLPFGPTAYFHLHDVVTRHDNKDKELKTVSQAYPHLILNNFSTKIGERTANILRHLFPVPKPDTKRIITFANDADYISFSIPYGNLTPESVHGNQNNSNPNDSTYDTPVEY
nr:U3 small nucleolar ribonucleoprotein protein IMP4 [Tanacetum cinerariifolium]